MKYMIFVMAALVLLFGCVTPQVPETHEPESITPIEVPVVEEGGPVEKLSIESVNRAFQHTDYEIYDNSNPFSDGVGGDLGKTSTSYIKVDEEDLAFLSGDCDEQEQEFWFNLRTKDEQGVIFEAVYSINLAGECSTVKFLGQEYEIEVIDKPESGGDKIVRGGAIKLKGADSSITLQDGGRLNNDDRWPVVLGWKNGELVKIIVYMGGYFYDVEADSSIVPLFGSGNAVLAGFTNMEENPTFELITTDMSGVKKVTEEYEHLADTQEINFTMYNVIRAHGELYHTEYTRMDDDGIYIEFNPPLQTFVPTYTWEDMRTDWYEWNIDILGVDYKLISLNGSESSVSLARESSSSCEVNESAFSKVGEEIGCSDGSFYRLIYSGNEEKLMHLEDELTLKDGENGVEVVWNYKETSNPELKSIFISLDSDIYEGIDKESQETVDFSETIYLDFVVSDEDAAKKYNGYEILNSSGMYIIFDNPLKVCTTPKDGDYTYCKSGAVDSNYDYASETHHISIPILDKSYKLSCLAFNKTSNTSELCLAKEENHAYLNPYQCVPFDEDFSNTLDVDGRRFVFLDYKYYGNYSTCEINSSGLCIDNLTLSMGESVNLTNGGILHLWKFAPGYTYCAAWVGLAYFSDEMRLEDGIGGIELVWENESSALKSVFIPANSSAYEKLTK